MPKSNKPSNAAKPLENPAKPIEGKGAPVTASEAQAFTKALTNATGGTPRRKPFNWPANPDGVKAHRAGTKRAYVIETLTGEGATFSDIANSPTCQWDRRTCYEGIKLLHTILGYGLTEDPETGIIRAFVA